MIKWIFSYTLLTILSFQAAFATVPTQALTFGTNIEISNATTTMYYKIRKAEELIKKVIATDAFRDRVINHTYNGAKTFVDNGGYTNAQIYQKILDGAERLNNIANNVMDLQIEMYYESSSTVGYTYSSSPKIYANTKFYNTYTPAQMTGNMTHEWLHKLGFTHAYYYSSSRDYSVPYAIGKILRELAATVTVDGEYFTAPADLSVSNTSSTITLNWNPATSSNGIETYKIYRKLSTSSTFYLQGSTTGQSYTQSLPSSNATYYVRAVDSTGKTIDSAQINFMKLAPVTNLSLTTTTTNINLSWSPAISSAGIKEYKIFRRLYGSSTNYFQGSTTSLTFTQVKPSSTAYYYVRAVDNNGNTVKSVEVKYTK